MKVAALVSGRNTPSGRFRVMQHISPLREHGIEVKAYVPQIDKSVSVPVPTGTPALLRRALAVPWTALKLATRIPGVAGSWRAEATWLNRELLRGFYSLEPLLKVPVVLDVDDAIWLSKPFGLVAAKRVARRARVVIAGNRFLADWFGQYCGDVEIIPTAVDISVYTPRERSRDDFRFGWIGTSSNLHHVERLEGVFRRFLTAHPDARFSVVCDKPPRFRMLEESNVEYTRWTPDTEIAGFRSLDVGLMPLDDNEWTRGKCSFKMLQYMSAGAAVIVSPVGMNTDVLGMGEVGFAATDDDEWLGALEHLYAHRDDGTRMGHAGRAVVEREFSAERVVARIAAVFRRVVV